MAAESPTEPESEQQTGTEAPEVGDGGLEPRRVAQMQRGGEAVLIDIRQAEEWDRARIPGALHIVLEEITPRVSEVPRDRTVVFYCRGGNRSEMVAAAFRHDGYEAFSMAGGLRAWEADDLPLEPEGASVV